MKHMQRDLEQLKRHVLTMGALVEQATNWAITALVDRRVELARDVMVGDNQIDQMELMIEEECLKLLALHQPVAGDLRFVVSVMKVNNDLERMGDLAINIAERAAFLAEEPPLSVPLDFPRMAEVVRRMVRDSLDSLVRLDTDLARRVCVADDEVDEINRGMFVRIEDVMRSDPESVERAVHSLSASRHLERIADLATNIAEDVVFMVEAEVIKHRHEDFRHGK
ncbi:MAG: phosphate signaling complex protein PhoU [Planctomycetota bacterium]